MLPSNTWVNAPSLTLPWLLYTKIPSRLVVALLAGGAVAAICWGARSRERMRGALRFGTLAATLLVLNAAWYAFVYHIQGNLASLERTLHEIETLAPADARITIVVPADAEPMSALSYHGKFWLDRAAHRVLDGNDRSAVVHRRAWRRVRGGRAHGGDASRRASRSRSALSGRGRAPDVHGGRRPRRADRRRSLGRLRDARTLTAAVIPSAVEGSALRPPCVVDARGPASRFALRLHPSVELLPAMTSPADRVIGRLIADRYRVVALVGSGGMGEVYRAEHVGLKRPTALKFMRPALGQDADALARFRREAEQASRISHPNVAAIYDFGDTGDGHVFLAMEFIEGESLADRIAREGRLPPADAAQIILGAAAGLGAAHRRGILHRDLKPANIMLAAECRTGVEHDPHAVGTVKLVDFGIARSIMGDIKAPDAAAAGPALTRTGMVLGTPAYASPEQLAGEPLDARSDLYTLGLIAFEALTGQPAFATTNARELIAHRLLGSPRAVTDVLRPVTRRGPTPCSPCSTAHSPPIRRSATPTR